jgi:hypothetical protein
MDFLLHVCPGAAHILLIGQTANLSVRLQAASSIGWGYGYFFSRLVCPM